MASLKVRSMAARFSARVVWTSRESVMSWPAARKKRRLAGPPETSRTVHRCHRGAAPGGRVGISVVMTGLCSERERRWPAIAG